MARTPNTNREDAVKIIELVLRGDYVLGYVDRTEDYAMDSVIITLGVNAFPQRYSTTSSPGNVGPRELEELRELLIANLARVRHIRFLSGVVPDNLPGIEMTVEVSGAAYMQTRRGYQSVQKSMLDMRDALDKIRYTMAPDPLLDLNPPKPKPPKVKDIGESTEPILAYRDFDIKWVTWDNPLLYSRNGAQWPTRQPMIAQCGASGQIKLNAHDAPQVDCECGIYAFDSHTHTDLKNNAVAWGEVLLWGEVIICESGYRAEFAYPKTVFIRDTGVKLTHKIAQKVEERYGVPVHLLESRHQTASELMDMWIRDVLK